MRGNRARAITALVAAIVGLALAATSAPVGAAAPEAGDVHAQARNAEASVSAFPVLTRFETLCPGMVEYSVINAGKQAGVIAFTIFGQDPFSITMEPGDVQSGLITGVPFDFNGVILQVDHTSSGLALLWNPLACPPEPGEAPSPTPTPEPDPGPANGPLGSDAPIEVMHVASCLADNGRVDTNIVNTGAEAATYRIEFPGLSARAFEIGPGDWWRMPITGRADDAYEVVVLRDDVEVSRKIVDVSCDEGAAVVSGDELQVVNACRDGRGYILFQFLNPTPESRPWIIEIPGVPNRSTSAAGWGQSIRAITGRLDGPLAVTVRSGAEVVDEFSVNVNCTPPPNGA